jgi:hypothetical protein
MNKDLNFKIESGNSPPLFLLVSNKLDEDDDDLSMTRLERVYCNDYKKQIIYP